MAPLTLIGLLAVVAGAPPVAQPVPGAHLRVELLTIGPGPAAYSRFGHSALRVTDRRGRGDIVFDFGTFDEDQPRVIGRFLQGRLQYFLSVDRYEETLNDVREQGRLLLAQELRLTGPQRLRLFRRLRRLTRPEHKHYRYHHFTQNCATRIRDELDRELGGQIRTQLRRIPAGTRRHWIRRATRGAPGFHLMFDLILTHADAPASLWEASFAPEALRDGLARVRIRRGMASVPLVIRTRVLHRGEGFGAAVSDSRWGFVLVLFGLLGLLLLPLVMAATRTWSWRLAGGALLVWGALQLVCAVVFIGLQLYATLEQFRGNLHLAILSPMGIFFAWAGVGILRHGGQRPAAPPWMTLVLGVNLGLACLTWMAWPSPNPWIELWILALLLNGATLLVLRESSRRAMG